MSKTREDWINKVQPWQIPMLDWLISKHWTDASVDAFLELDDDPTLLPSEFIFIITVYDHLQPSVRNYLAHLIVDDPLPHNEQAVEKLKLAGFIQNNILLDKVKEWLFPYAQLNISVEKIQQIRE